MGWIGFLSAMSGRELFGAKELPAETQVVEPKPIVDEETEVVLKARDFAMMVGYFMGYT